jgi:hypothetical protein
MKIASGGIAEVTTIARQQSFLALSTGLPAAA